jgi:hypothetical protein
MSISRSAILRTTTCTLRKLVLEAAGHSAWRTGSHQHCGTGRRLQEWTLARREFSHASRWRQEGGDREKDAKSKTKIYESLPSTEEKHRLYLARRFSNVMDKAQENIVLASQRINDLTGYSGIEALKEEIARLGKYFSCNNLLTEFQRHLLALRVLLCLKLRTHIRKQ